MEVQTFLRFRFIRLSRFFLSGWGAVRYRRISFIFSNPSTVTFPAIYGCEEDDKKMDIDMESKTLEKRQIIPKEVLTFYISQARKHNPKIPDKVVNKLIKIYTDMRQNTSGKNRITATPRQLESVIRLSEARARARFSEFIEEEDIDEAIRLIKVAIQQAATDPVAGVIDMDLILTGMTSFSREKYGKIIDIVKIILRDFSETARKGVKLISLLEEVKNMLMRWCNNPLLFLNSNLKMI